MNYLITGAAGFLGSTLANYLTKEGHMVRGIDDLSTGDPSVLSPDVLFTRGDINDRPKLWTLLQEIDCVYHLAARVSVPESVLYPREYTQVNVGGTVSLMEAMRDVGVGRVVLTSSGAIYGDQAVQPISESATPNPKSPYAVSKLSAEYYVNTIGDLWGIETVSLRIFNAYGPNQRLPVSHPPVIPNFLKQIIKGGTVVMHGDGHQTRDYVFVDDVVSSLIASSTAPNINHRVINIGSGTETSILDLIRIMAEITNIKPEVITNPQKNPGSPNMSADISLAKQLLGFQPRFSLEEGLRLTLERDPRFKRTLDNSSRTNNFHS